MEINIKIPTTWNQLSPRQLIGVAFSLEQYHSRPAITREYPEIRQSLYFQLIGQLLKENSWWKKRIAKGQFPPAAYKEPSQFLFGECTRTVFIPKFRLNWITFHPPGDRLKNITIEEFSLADSLFVNYRKTQDVRYLDNLCATLYRRADGNELDIRKPFSKILIEKEVRHFQKLSLKKKLAILYAFTGCRNIIATAHPHVFPQPKELLDIEGNPVKKEPAPYVPFGKLIQHKINFDPSKLEPTLKLNVWAFLGNYENELAELENQKK